VLEYFDVAVEEAQRVDRGRGRHRRPRGRISLRAVGGGRRQRRLRGLSHSHQDRRRRIDRRQGLYDSGAGQEDPCRYETLDTDLLYTGRDLDRSVIAPNQIRTVLETYRDNLFTELFPGREHVPKTLIFAKDDHQGAHRRTTPVDWAVMY
jgi:hypothetical protein